MTALPPALEPWRTTLEPMTPDLALALGPWVRRLHVALGPLRARSTVEGDAPEGYDGLARRGPYDRLLLSEWAMRRAAPLEFLRRATMDEHLFLDLKRVEPHSDLETVALFDAGPEQLGQPRLVHVALLAVLAARAEAAGARFAWGIVQDFEGPLTEHAERAAVRRLLGARTIDLPDAVDLTFWEERLAERPPTSERWWIGGPSLTRRLAGCSNPLAGDGRITVETTDAFDSLSVHLHAAERDARLRLDRLDDARAVSLLRDPFPRPRPTGPTVRATSWGPAFGLDGQRLLVRTTDGRVTAHHLSSSSQPAGLPRTFTPEEPTERLVAVGTKGRRIFAVTWTTDGQLACYGAGSRKERGLSRRRLTSPPPFEITPLAPRQTPPPCFLLQTGWRESSLHALTPEGHLLRIWTAPDGRADVRLVLDSVTAVGHSGFRLLAVRSPGPTIGAYESIEPRSIVLIGDDGIPRTLIRDHGDEHYRVVFGHARSKMIGEGHPLVAIDEGDDTWSLFFGANEWSIRPESEARVVGAAMWHGQEPGLVVISADRKTLRHVGARTTRDLVVSAEPVTAATCSPTSPSCAYVTDSGRIVAISLKDGRPLLTLDPSPADEGS